MSAFRGLRAWTRFHPLAADTALAAAVLAAAILSSRTWTSLYGLGDPLFRLPTTAEELGGLAAVIAPLALRRRAPLTALLACTAGLLVARYLLHSVEPTITSIALAIALYSAAAYGRPRWRNVACAVSVVAVMFQMWGDVAETLPPEVPDRLLVLTMELLVSLVLFCAMWALGSAIGAGRRRAAELLERTMALEREREENARRAVFDERVRIARELHDVVAHHVSVMGVQAGAARLVMGRDPSKAERGAGLDRGFQPPGGRRSCTGCSASCARTGDPDDLRRSPGVSAAAGAGRRRCATRSSTVDVGIEGDERPLPPTVDVSAYRIVQEALTNTLKHAGASRADVRLRYWPEELEVEVARRRSRRGARARTGRGGLGLIGMRERAALHGGQLTAGPASGGGFAVRATLPTPDGAP